MRVPVEDMTFVVRTAGERTAGASAGLLRMLVERAGGNTGAQVHVIEERPFAAAVRRTIEIGTREGRPWLVGMDGDVLLLGDAIERIGGLCASADGAVFSIAGLMLCRFFGGMCFRGIHCYPMAKLAGAVEAVDDRELRPESALGRVMEGKGWRMWGPPVVLGVHDHEQWLRHVYVKMRLRARRDMADSEKTWRETFGEVERRREEGPDLVVAAWGLEDGREDALAGGTAAPSNYDWEASQPKFLARMREHGMVERGPWDGDAMGFAERVIGAHGFVEDRRTPAWIRERHGFALGAAHAVRRAGLPPVRPALAGRAVA